MKILKLTLKNFKGIKSFTLDTNGGNADIFGDNATGKTTLFDAFIWLLFDKDSQNKKDFAVKTLDHAGNTLQGLDHEVEGTFEIGGKKLTLRKIYTEKWTKKRGSAAAVFTGNETSYFIDGVPAKKNEYTARIAAIADENIFKLLTSPVYFNEVLHWQDRRKILLEVCGDISDSDVIASDSALARLPEILGDRKLEDHRKVIAARRTEINKELEKIPVRIDEATRSLPDVAGINASEIPGKIVSLKARVAEKNKEIARIQGGGEVAERTRTLRELEGKILDIRNRHRTEVDGKVQGKRDELNGLRDKLATVQQNIRSKKLRIQGNETFISEAEAKAGKLREEWYSLNGQQFTFEQETVCPTCGQSLPEDKLAEAREKAEAAFKLQKAQRLEEISIRGKGCKVDAERLKTENEGLSKEIEATQNEAQTLESKAQALQDDINGITVTATDINQNPEYIRAMAEKESLEVEIVGLNSDTSGQIVSVQAEIRMLEGELASLETLSAQVEQYNKGQERIGQLKAQEKALAAEYERLEGELYLTEQFIRTKVCLLESRINSKFKMARFKLFDVQVNGGVAECCETLYQGVPYNTGLNNAARINVGLDIINTLSEHYGFVAPIFVDNAEAVTTLIQTRGQVIRLVVSAQDKKLRVESEAVIKGVA